MMVAEPEYACAILEDGRGRFLLELRPVDARHAGGRLTCFGGRREAGETAEECVRRELQEELGWQPELVEPSVDLWVRGAWIARFFRAALTVGVEKLQTLPGHTAELLMPDDLREARVSPWHAAVLAAYQRREAVVRLEE